MSVLKCVYIVFCVSTTCVLQSELCHMYLTVCDEPFKEAEETKSPLQLVLHSKWSG